MMTFPVWTMTICAEGSPPATRSMGSARATLAGDALQSAAFEWVLTCPTLEDAVRARMGLILARAAGLDGMCGGQYLDMEAEGTQPSLEELTLIHGRKTAALLRAACQIGVLCARASAPYGCQFICGGRLCRTPWNGLSN